MFDGMEHSRYLLVIFESNPLTSSILQLFQKIFCSDKIVIKYIVPGTGGIKYHSHIRHRIPTDALSERQPEFPSFLCRLGILIELISVDP